MSKRKYPDSDSNIIQSLDDQQSDTQETKVELKHFYYEPKKMCDVQIIYNNIAFHLHMVTLARDSVYFLNLFEEKDMNKSPVNLPVMKDFYGQIIDAKHVKYFFDRIYMYEPLKYNDIAGSATQCPLFALIYLSHYFQAERLEKNLKAIVTQFVATGYSTTYNKNFLWALTVACQVCKWSEIEIQLIGWIGADLKSFMNLANGKLLKFNSNTKQRVYLKALTTKESAVLENETREDWQRIAREVTDVITNPNIINAIASIDGGERSFRDTITEAILVAALKHRKVLP